MPKRATRKGVTPAKRSPKRKQSARAAPAPKSPPAKTETAEPGRPSLYRPEYCQKILTYFEFKDVTFKAVSADNGKAVVVKDVPELPTFAAFADSIGVHRQTLHEWCKVHPEFSDAYARARDRLERMIWKHGMTGDYSPHMAQFFLKTRLGVVEKIAVIGGEPEEGDKPVQVTHDLPPEVKEAMARVSLRAKAVAAGSKR